MAKKQTWQKCVSEVEFWQTSNSASVRETAEHFGWSVGNTSEMLNLAAALRCYEKMQNIEKKTEAIAFMKKQDFHRMVE